MERASRAPEDHPAAEVVTFGADDIRTRARSGRRPPRPPEVGLGQSQAFEETSGQTEFGNSSMHAMRSSQSENIQDWERPPDARAILGSAAMVKVTESEGRAPSRK